jgi:hypothetical protein
MSIYIYIYVIVDRFADQKRVDGFISEKTDLSLSHARVFPRLINQFGDVIDDDERFAIRLRLTHYRSLLLSPAWPITRAGRR